MTSATKYEEFAKALRAVLQPRGIAPTGPALAAALRQGGVTIHPNTLKHLLEGSRSPKPSTIDSLLQGLSATTAERAMLTGAADPDAVPPVVSLIESLTSSGRLDRGRFREAVSWYYVIGDSDDGDRCAERRITEVNADGLSVASIASGQFGLGRFNLLDLPRLQMRVRARRLSPAEGSKVDAVLHVAELEPGSNKYRTLVFFSPAPTNERLEWVVEYRWPGLWASLRSAGRASAHFTLQPPPMVTEVRIIIEVSSAQFPDLQLLPPAGLGSVERRPGADPQQLILEWRIPAPPQQLHFEIVSPSHHTG